MPKRVAIVGGGPGGSAFAITLVRSGIDPRDVVILDKARFPRPKLCGGGVTHRGTALLEELLGHVPADGGETIGLQFRSKLGRFDVRERGSQWVFDRGTLDEQLLLAARALGVEVREGVQVTSVRPTTDGYRIAWRGGSESFPWVVGADGATSFVRREAGLPGGTVGRLLEAVFEPVSADVDPNVLYFDFDPVLDGIPGYAWIFPYPKPGSTGLYKLGIMDGRGVVPGERLRDWTLHYASRHGFRLLDGKLQGWPEHYYAFSARSARPRLLLTGEAFGIDPLLGEGITPAIEISRYAAVRLARALRNGSDSVPFYELGYVLSTEGRNLLYQGALANRLYGDHPYRWMRVLFENRGIHDVAGSGNVMYGRMTGKSVSLGWAFFREMLRSGFPSNAPVSGPFADELSARATRPAP